MSLATTCVFFIGIVVVLALRRRFLRFRFLPPPGVVGMVICTSNEVDSGTADWNLKQATAALFLCSAVMAIQTAVHWSIDVLTNLALVQNCPSHTRLDQHLGTELPLTPAACQSTLVTVAASTEHNTFPIAHFPITKCCTCSSLHITLTPTLTQTLTINSGYQHNRARYITPPCRTSLCTYTPYI